MLWHERDALLELQAGYGVSPKAILSALATLMPLQWCFRLICRYRETEDSAIRERYTQILEFVDPYTQRDQALADLAVLGEHHGLGTAPDPSS